MKESTTIKRHTWISEEDAIAIMGFGAVGPFAAYCRNGILKGKISYRKVGRKTYEFSKQDCNNYVKERNAPKVVPANG